MKKTFTSWVTLLVALVLAMPAKAQEFWEKVGEPVSTIEEGVNYLIECPWTSNDVFMAPTGSVKFPLAQAIWNFEKVGDDTDGTPLYRLKNMQNGEYVMHPQHTGGHVRTSASLPKAITFTCMPGIGLSKYQDEGGQLTQEWLDTDQRCVYYNGGQEFVNVFVFCNHDKNTDRPFLLIRDGSNVGFHQWGGFIDARIHYIYKAQKVGAYDNFCNSMQYNFPNGVQGLFAGGNNPGQVPAEFVAELEKTYAVAEALVSDNTQADEAYINAYDALMAAYKACKEGVVPVTAGYYLIKNHPESNHTNAHLFVRPNNDMGWQDFTLPESAEAMTVDAARFVWKAMPVKDVENGWNLYNCGSGRFGGGWNKNNIIIPSFDTNKQVYTINYRTPGHFSIDMIGQNAQYPSIHAVANNHVVIWGPYSKASQWSFIRVDSTLLDGVNAQVAQNNLNVAASRLLTKAQNLYAKGFSYTAEGCTRDGVFVQGDGLLTTEDQMFCNAPESPDREPGNALGNLLDNSYKTYFHTAWAGAESQTFFHYLDVRLNDAIDCFNIKYAKRNNNGEGSPLKIHVFASNDTVGGNWTDQGYMNCEYPYTLKYTNDDGTPGERANWAGIASLQMDGKYSYIRLQVEGAKPGKKFWYWSELRMYASAYDPSISLIEAVPADVRKAFEDNMKAIKEEIAAKKVQQTTYDALQKAYDLFNESFPDPQALVNQVNAAKAKAEGAANSEGTEVGYYQEGASAALAEAVAAIEAQLKPIMTVDEINKIKADLEKALADFNAMLIVPESGQFFYIKSATASTAEGSAKDKYLYAQNNDQAQVKYALYERMYDRPEFLWKSIKNADGSFSFMNVATGTYLGNPEKHNARVDMSWEPDTLKLSGTNVGGVFNFVSTDNVYYNAQPGTGNLVTWNSATGSDNSAFILEAVEMLGEPWDGYSVHHNFAGKNAEVVSKPYALCGLVEGADLYKVLGMKDGLLQLKPYAVEDVIPAGTPFIAIPNGEANADGVYEAVFNMPTSADYTQLQYVLEGQKQNGLLATIQTKEDIVGGGILFENNVITAVEGDKSRCNSGYFAEMPAATEEAGTLTMTFPETVTGIVDVIANSVAKGGVYSLTGVKVRNNADTKGLPKGLYIVGGQKVLVK